MKMDFHYQFFELANAMMSIHALPLSTRQNAQPPVSPLRHVQSLPHAHNHARYYICVPRSLNSLSQSGIFTFHQFGCYDVSYVFIWIPLIHNVLITEQIYWKNTEILFLNLKYHLINLLIFNAFKSFPSGKCN